MEFTVFVKINTMNPLGRFLLFEFKEPDLNAHSQKEGGG